MSRVAFPLAVDVELVTLTPTSPSVPPLRITPIFPVIHVSSSLAIYSARVKLKEPGTATGSLSTITKFALIIAPGSAPPVKLCRTKGKTSSPSTFESSMML